MIGVPLPDGMVYFVEVPGTGTRAVRSWLNTEWGPVEDHRGKLRLTTRREEMKRIGNPRHTTMPPPGAHSFLTVRHPVKRMESLFHVLYPAERSIEAARRFNQAVMDHIDGWGIPQREYIERCDPDYVYRIESLAGVPGCPLFPERRGRIAPRAKIGGKECHWFDETKAALEEWERDCPWGNWSWLDYDEHLVHEDQATHSLIHLTSQ